MLKYSLWNIPGISLLIPGKSGILYANQTGGYATLEQIIEGWLLPLVTSLVDQQAELTRYFTSPPWNGTCANGIDQATADFIDVVLQMSPYSAWLCVDRQQLLASHEAWIYVIPVQLQDTETIQFDDFHFSAGIVTWTNSD
jgi:Family of unknown function (DUF6210)